MWNSLFVSLSLSFLSLSFSICSPSVLSLAPSLIPGDHSEHIFSGRGEQVNSEVFETLNNLDIVTENGIG